MRRVTAVAVLTLSLTALSSATGAQDARQRQAAAEAYDRGTTAYVNGAYEEAARWFETANRLAPTSAALMQAIRAHEHNDNPARAATLALELSATYASDSTAAEFANNVLTKYAHDLLRVEVSCDEDCKLDVDGKLQDYMKFFVSPDAPHHLTATFETGSKTADVQGGAGETRSVEFQAPPPPPAPPLATVNPSEAGAATTHHAPLPPLATWIGAGVTVALGAATIVSGLNAKAGVPAYERATTALANCRMTMTDCSAEQAKATSLLHDGQGRELRTNILIAATAVAAVGTGVIAFFFTDWSGDREKAQTALTHFRLAPLPGGAMTGFEGEF